MKISIFIDEFLCDSSIINNKEYLEELERGRVSEENIKYLIE